MAHNRIIHVYQRFAVWTLNFIIMFVVVNLVLWIPFAIRDATKSPPPIERFGLPTILTAYPGWRSEDVISLLHETWSRELEYEAYTQFKEAEFHGEYVNVSSAGFRVTKNQGPWPPSPSHFNIFLFGGSTTFGYGQPDNQTIASHLQTLANEHLTLNVRVYNFGRGFYFSTQERVLFDRMAAAIGDRINLAIFIDGLNDAYIGSSDEPVFTEDYRDLVRTGGNDSLMHRIPLMRMAQSLQARMGPVTKPPTHHDENTPTAVIERLTRNKSEVEAIANAVPQRSIKTMFILQPVAPFAESFERHPFANTIEDFGPHVMAARVYRFIADSHLQSGEDDSLQTTWGAEWCAKVAPTGDAPHYVDRVHYSAAMSKAIARRILDLMIRRRVIND